MISYTESVAGTGAKQDPARQENAGVTSLPRVGNALCLDFANTVNKRPEPDRDELMSSADLMTWAAQMGLTVTGRAQQGGIEPARQLRETVYQTFAAVSRRDSPPESGLGELARCYAMMPRPAGLAPAGESYRLRWPPADAPGVLWFVAASAIELLTRGPLDRIGQCPSCRWLFLDTSRNRRRRWCDMQMCGGRDKVQRFRARD
jgi:predicted RNA-binding Zn ribbon-like protein